MPLFINGLGMGAITLNGTRYRKLTIDGVNIPLSHPVNYGVGLSNLVVLSSGGIIGACAAEALEVIYYATNDTGHRLYESRDGGDTFSFVADIPDASYSKNGLSCSSDGVKMVMNQVNGGESGVVYYSKNSGRTWTSNKLHSTRRYWVQDTTCEGDGGHFWAIALEFGTGNTVVLKSSSGAIDTWTRVYISNVTTSSDSRIAVNQSGASVFIKIGPTYYAYSSNSGVSFTTRPNPVTSNNSDLAMARTTAYVYVAPHSSPFGLYRSSNFGASWTYISTPTRDSTADLETAQGGGTVLLSQGASGVNSVQW